MAYPQSMKKRWPIMAGMAVFIAASACRTPSAGCSCRRWRLLCACWVSGCPGGCWPKRWAQSASAPADSLVCIRHAGVCGVQRTGQRMGAFWLPWLCCRGL